MNADIENAVKQCSTCLEYQNMQPQEKTTAYEILVQAKPWEVVGTDASMINNENLLCIVDYYSKFPVVKKVENLAAKDLIQAAKWLYLLSLACPKNWFQMQARILFQSNLKIFAGTWT